MLEDWQKVAIDLVGAMLETEKGIRWIMVFTDHFTRCKGALAIPDAAALVAVDHGLCCIGLPEQIHINQGAQFKAQLMTELCLLWNLERMHTAPYHSHANGIVEWNNRLLGDSLRVLLLRRGQDEWDQLLPQLMSA